MAVLRTVMMVSVMMAAMFMMMFAIMIVIGSENNFRCAHFPIFVKRNSGKN